MHSSPQTGPSWFGKLASAPQPASHSPRPGTAPRKHPRQKSCLTLMAALAFATCAFCCHLVVGTAGVQIASKQDSPFVGLLRFLLLVCIGNERSDEQSFPHRGCVYCDVFPLSSFPEKLVRSSLAVLTCVTNLTLATLNVPSHWAHFSTPLACFYRPLISLDGKQQESRYWLVRELSATVFHSSHQRDFCYFLPKFTHGQQKTANCSERCACLL